MSTEQQEQVDRLIHDANSAKGGANFARMMRDAVNAKVLDEKAARLRAEALRLDPTKSAPSWEYDEVGEPS